MASDAFSRSGRVRRPRSTRYVSIVPGDAPCSLRTPSRRLSRAGSRPISSAQQRVGVPRDELRPGVQHEVGAQLQRTLAQGSGEGAVHDRGHPAAERAAERRQVGDLHHRVGRRLQPDEVRPVGGGQHLVGVGHVHPPELQPVARGPLVGRRRPRRGSSGSAAPARRRPAPAPGRRAPRPCRSRTPARCRPPGRRPLPPGPTRSGSRTGRSRVRPGPTARPRRRSRRTPPVGSAGRRARARGGRRARRRSRGAARAAVGASRRGKGVDEVTGSVFPTACAPARAEVACRVGSAAMNPALPESAR